MDDEIYKIEKQYPPHLYEYIKGILPTIKVDFMVLPYTLSTYFP